MSCFGLENPRTQTSVVSNATKNSNEYRTNKDNKPINFQLHEDLPSR